MNVGDRLHWGWRTVIFVIALLYALSSGWLFYNIAMWGTFWILGYNVVEWKLDLVTSPNMGIGTRIWNALIVLIALVLIWQSLLWISRKLKGWIVRWKRLDGRPILIRKLEAFKVEATASKARAFNDIVRDLEDLGDPVGSFRIDLRNIPTDQEFEVQRAMLLEQLDDLEDRTV
jgi:hypothetical protein